MNINEIIIALSFVKGIGKVKTKKILTSLQNFNLTNEEFIDHIKNENMIKENEIVFFKQYLSKADKILEITNNSKIKVVNYLEEQFPKQLKTIPNPPIQLFIKGNVDSLNNFEKSIAVIFTSEGKNLKSLPVPAPIIMTLPEAFEKISLLGSCQRHSLYLVNRSNLPEKLSQNFTLF